MMPSARAYLRPCFAFALTVALGPITGCDDLVDESDPMVLRTEPVVEGTWPPSGGTLNTAWLGNTPLMQIIPPDSPASCDPEDACVTEIELEVEIPPTFISSASAPQGELVVVADGVEYRGHALVGSRWWLDVAKTHYLTITDYAEEGDNFGYQLEHVQVTGSDPASVICEPDADGDRWTYLLGNLSVDIGSGNPSVEQGALLVACASGAMGKALTWGFKPWKKNGSMQDLKIYEAGVRAVRADYCGDGTSFTEDDTLIQVSNESAGQTFFDPSASTEAVFGPNGALCLSSPRVAPPGPLCSIPTCGSDEAVASMVNQNFRIWTKLAG